MSWRGPTLGQLGDHLSARGLIGETDAWDDACHHVVHDPALQPVPWYLRVLIGVCAWVAAGFFVSWAACFVLCTAEGGGASLMGVSAVLGVPSAILGVATAALPMLYGEGRRRRWEEVGEAAPPAGPWQALGAQIVLDFLAQLALGGTLAGVGGATLGFAILTEEPVPTAMLLVVQCAILLAYPHPVMRFLAAFGLGGGATVALFESGVDHLLADVTVLAALIGVVVLAWLRPVLARTPVHAALAPIAYGLAAWALVAPLLGELEITGADGPVLAVGAPGVALAVVVAVLAEQRALLSLTTPVAVLGTLALGAITWPVPAVMVALVVIALAIRGRDMTLLVGATVALVGYGGRFWFDLPLADGPKLAALVGMGLAFAGLHVFALWLGRRGQVAA